MSSASKARLEIPVTGMDCAECARHVRAAIEGVPGVCSVEVFLAGERAVVGFEPESRPSVDGIREAVRKAGYGVPELDAEPAEAEAPELAGKVFRILGLVFGAVLLVVVAGEWLGLLAEATRHIPAPIGWLLVAVIAYPVLWKVVRAAWNRQVIAHTLMTVGLVAALLVGEWATAAVVAFFMRVGDFVEGFTTDQARESVRALMSLAPDTARVERDGAEALVPVEEVRIGDVVRVRPGERVPVDGLVTQGRAFVDQSSLTGESLPLDASTGSAVFAGSIVHEGTLALETTAVGSETAFGRVIRLVEEAEASRGTVQRVADRFSTWYLPVVGLVALLTYLARGDVMATVAVLVVACSCAFALATPVAMLASIGAGARRGLVIKGGRVLESLHRVDVLLLDKTGTVTFGRPKLTDVVPLDGATREELLALAASVERASEHPFAEAVRRAAREEGLVPVQATDFQALPGLGVRARVGDALVSIGREEIAPEAARSEAAGRLRAAGKSVVTVDVDGRAAGVLAAADVLRPDVPPALDRLRKRGLTQLALLTGDHDGAASVLAGRLGLPYRAGLLPADKIEVVREWQRRGHVVAMIGDGVNDAPALVQADVGIALGEIGSDVALEAADVVVLRDDWSAVADLFDVSRRTMRVVYGNIGFTGLYNLVGLTLAALGFLPPILAAAAQSLPDLGILANSARLIRR